MQRTCAAKVKVKVRQNGATSVEHGAAAMPGLHAQVAREPPPACREGRVTAGFLGLVEGRDLCFCVSSQKIERNEKAAVGNQDWVVNLVVNGLLRAVRALLGLCLYC